MRGLTRILFAILAISDSQNLLCRPLLFDYKTNLEYFLLCNFVVSASIRTKSKYCIEMRPKNSPFSLYHTWARGRVSHPHKPLLKMWNGCAQKRDFLIFITHPLLPPVDGPCPRMLFILLVPRKNIQAIVLEI